MPVKGGYSSVLEAAAMAMAGEDGCCSQRGDSAECCMSDRAREVFAAIESAGGPSLEQIERIARGATQREARGNLA